MGVILTLPHPAHAQDSQSSEVSEPSELSKEPEASTEATKQAQAPRYPLSLRLSHSGYQSENLLITRYLQSQLSSLFEVTETAAAQAPQRSRITNAHQNQIFAHLKTTSIGGKARWALQLSFQPATEDTSKLPAGNLYWQLDGQGLENLPQLAKQLATQLTAILGVPKPQYNPTPPRPREEIFAQLSQLHQQQKQAQQDAPTEVKLIQLYQQQQTLCTELNLRLFTNPAELSQLFEPKSPPLEQLNKLRESHPQLDYHSPTNSQAYQNLISLSLPWYQKNQWLSTPASNILPFSLDDLISDQQIQLAIDKQLLPPQPNATPNYALYCWAISQPNRLKPSLPAQEEAEKLLTQAQARKAIQPQADTLTLASLFLLNQQEQQAQLRRQLNRKFDPALQPHWPELRAQLRLGLLHAHGNAAKDSPFTQALLTVLQDSNDGDDLLLYRTISLSHQGEISEQEQAQARQEVTQFIWQGRELAQNHPAFFPYLLALAAEINQNETAAPIDAIPAEIKPEELQPNQLLPALQRWSKNNLKP